MDEPEGHLGDAVLDLVNLVGDCTGELLNGRDRLSVNFHGLSGNEPVLIHETANCNVPHLAVLEELEPLAGQPVLHEPTGSVVVSLIRPSPDRFGADAETRCLAVTSLFKLEVYLGGTGLGSCDLGRYLGLLLVICRLRKLFRQAGELLLVGLPLVVDICDRTTSLLDKLVTGPTIVELAEGRKLVDEVFIESPVDHGPRRGIHLSERKVAGHNCSGDSDDSGSDSLPEGNVFSRGLRLHVVESAPDRPGFLYQELVYGGGPCGRLGRGGLVKT